MMKKCVHCGKIKLIDEFYRDKSKNDGYNSRCKVCCDESTESWRERHPDIYHSYWKSPMAKLTGKKWRGRQKKGWKVIIKDKGLDYCQRCRYSLCFAAIDFHHVDPEKKNYNIGHLLDKKPTPKLIEELDGVIALCCRCHREHHAGLWDLDEIKQQKINTDKPKIKDFLELAEEVSKDARGTTVSERRAINDFIRSKSKTIMRKKLDLKER